MNVSSSSAWLSCGLLAGMIVGGLDPVSSAEVRGLQKRTGEGKRTGEKIYQQKCASCHGAHGEGDKEKYPRPLTGDRSITDLARFISKRMPKDDPGTCVGEDARKVAAYIFTAFYSPTAQARNKPPRVELSRLTVTQYRNAVADLIAGFRTAKHDKVADLDNPVRRDTSQRGLQGTYYKLKFGDEDRVFERIDPEIRFDFKGSCPDSKNEELDDKQFSIRWRGSVLALETGEYEFMIRTEEKHGVRLWVNNLQRDRPLIDAWVRNHNTTEEDGKTEYRGSIFLLAGRVYPLQLDFSKQLTLNFNNDIPIVNKAAEEDLQASISLRWKPPQRAAEVIPQRSLMPRPSPEMFVVATRFPPDDRNADYERGTSISKAWDEAVMAAAIEVMGYVVARLPELAGVGLDAANARPHLRDFCLRFAERAFRQPLTAEQRRVYVDRPFAADQKLEMAVKRALLLILLSPQFLFRELGSPNAYHTASGLSFGLWDSLPDAALLQAAAAGRLATRAQAAQQAERMLTHGRTRAKLREFFLQWLKVDQVGDLAKNPQMYPGFNREITSDLRTSLELFLDDVAWSADSDFRQLWLTDTLYLNGRLAQFYGVKLPADAPFQKVAWHPGVLSHPYLMARFAHAAETSPILRGVFLTRHVLGRSLPPPPQAIEPLPEDSHPHLTTRERIALQTRPQACMACHGIINPLGFTLENFDPVGRLRDREKGKPIDATGVYRTRSDKEEKFGGPRDLAQFLAQSEEVQEAFVEQLFHYLVKQPIGAFGPQKRTELRRAFAAANYSIRKLLVAIMTESVLIAQKNP